MFLCKWMICYYRKVFSIFRVVGWPESRATRKCTNLIAQVNIPAIFWKRGEKNSSNSTSSLKSQSVIGASEYHGRMAKHFWINSIRKERGGWNEFDWKQFNFKARWHFWIWAIKSQLNAKFRGLKRVQSNFRKIKCETSLLSRNGWNNILKLSCVLLGWLFSTWKLEVGIFMLPWTISSRFVTKHEFSLTKGPKWLILVFKM